MDQGALARRLIDKIFDLELKKDALIKALSRYSVNVDSELFVHTDSLLARNLSRFLELRNPLGLTLTDIVKASMSIRLSEADQDTNLLNLKVRYLFKIVCQFRDMRHERPDAYRHEFKHAVRQLKRIKKFCKEYRSRSPIRLTRYPSVNSLKQLSQQSPSRTLKVR